MMSRRATIGVVLSLLAAFACGQIVWNQRVASVEQADDNPAAVAETKPDFELAAVKQKEIWDAEHIAFELEHTFGIPFRAAIQSRDRGRLTSFFRSEFTGRLLDDSQTITRVQSGIREVRTVSDAAAKSAGVNEVVDDLLAIAAPAGLTTIEAVGLRALDVLQTDADRWATRLLLTVSGTSDQSELVEFESTQQVEFLFGEENELGTKPVIVSWSHQSWATRTAREHFFISATHQVGLDRLPVIDNWELSPDRTQQYRFQFAVADFDRDGWLDIAVVEFERCYLLQRSRHDGQFHDVTYEMGIERKPLAPGMSLAGWIDYDNDGYPDLLLGNQLYHNEDGNFFKSVTAQSDLTFNNAAMPMGVQVADYDCDGRLDLYILYQPYGSSMDAAGWINADDDGVENRLWRNTGNGRFHDVTQPSGASGGKRRSFAATWFFYDEDHWPDLYIANDFSKNVLLRNNGDGTFTDLSEQSQAADFATTMGVASGDTNNDGRTDLYVANMYSKMGRRILGHIRQEDYPEGYYDQILGSCAGNRLYVRSSAGSGFEEVSAQQEVQGVGWAYAPTIADFDLDGYLDLYATTGFMSFDRKKPDG